MVFMWRSSLIFTVFSQFLFAQSALASANLSSEEYFDFLARVNQFSPLEHAGSHGTVGIGLGVGIANYEAPRSSDAMSEHWRGTSQVVSQGDSSPDRIYIPRAYLHKGLPLSLDGGFGVGQDPSTNAMLYSGYLQWTVYEGFAMPAFALRGSASRLIGLATTDASSLVGEVLASYGFLRLFTVYGSLGFGRHQAIVRSGQGYGTVMALSDDASGEAQKVMLRRSKSLGLQIQLVPPFITVAFEGATQAQGPTSYLAKLSFGM